VQAVWTDISKSRSRRSSQTCQLVVLFILKTGKGKIFCCLHCGYTDDADINAAKVILQRGLAILKSSTAGLAGSDARGEGTDRRNWL